MEGSVLWSYLDIKRMHVIYMSAVMRGDIRVYKPVSIHHLSEVSFVLVRSTC